LKANKKTVAYHYSKWSNKTFMNGDFFRDGRQPEAKVFYAYIKHVSVTDCGRLMQRHLSHKIGFRGPSFRSPINRGIRRMTWPAPM